MVKKDGVRLKEIKYTLYQGNFLSGIQLIFTDGIQTDMIGIAGSDEHTIKVEYPIKALSMCVIGGTLYCGIRLENQEESYYMEKLFGVEMQGAIWTDSQEVPDG